MTAHPPPSSATSPVNRTGCSAVETGASHGPTAGAQPLRFWHVAGEIVWAPGSGPLVFLTIPEARSMQRMALEAACDALAADPGMDGREALSLFWEINTAVRNANRWIGCMDPVAPTIQQAMAPGGGEAA